MQRDHFFYKRNLPHYQPPGGEFFITFRLANSLPKEKLARWKIEKEQLINSLRTKTSSAAVEKIKKHYFSKFDQLRDSSSNGESWLKEDRIAQIVADKLHEFDGKKYSLVCYCIMPNHVHLLVKLLASCKRDESRSTYPVTDILRLIKGSTAFMANKALGRSGQFWQHESYDHLVRNDKERDNIIRYILENPVKAGFTDFWNEWKWSYCRKVNLENM